MRVFLKNNVWEESLERIRYLYDEFEEVIITFSGGKDSTVVLNLACMVAKEKGRLPLKVMFFDLECEWIAVIDYIRRVFSREDIEPWWFQMPVRISNGFSDVNDWLMCWSEEEKEYWMRPKEKNAITKNVYSQPDFRKLFPPVMKHHFTGKKACLLAGIRAEETPRRMMGVTNGCTYKLITWGRILNEELDHYTFYPIYDWSYTDVWKAIHSNKWDYCNIYDKYYQYGVDIPNMRVSSINHDMAMPTMFKLPFLEMDTWDKAVRRMQGAHQTLHYGMEDIFIAPKELPFMFKNWIEYRDHLTANLIKSEKYKVIYRNEWKKYDDKFGMMPHYEKFVRYHIKCLLTNDWEMKTCKHYLTHDMIDFVKWVRGDLTEKPNSKFGGLHMKGIDLSKPWQEELARLKRNRIAG